MTFVTRKIYFIKKDFQTRFILRFVLSATVWAVLSIILFVLIADKRLDEIRYSTHIQVRTTSDILIPSTISVQVITLLIFAAMAAYALHSMWAGLAGPLYNLKKDIKRIASGELVSRVMLRDEDEFQDLAADIDKMRDMLRYRWGRIKERHDGLTSTAAELSRSIIKGSPSVSHATQLRESVERLKEEINVFKY